MSRRSLFTLPIVFFVIFSSAFSHAQLWSGILAPSRAVDWSNVGATITNRTTVCATFNPGASASQINAQLQSSNCKNGVVMLNAGTYNLTSGLDFGGKSNVTLRGAGADQTLLVFSGHAGCNGLLAAICIEGDSSLMGGGSGLNPDNTATITTSSLPKGTTQITLSVLTGSVSNLHVGNPIVIDQCDDGLTGASCSGTEVDTGNIYICESIAASCSDDGTGASGGQRPGRGQAQIVTITNISGNTVTFSPGLYMPNWKSSKSPQVYWSSAPSTSVGVENLSLDITNGGVQAGITIWNCYSCWVRGIRSIYTTHNSAAQRNHVWLVLSPHATVRDSYFYGSSSLHSEGYGIETFPSGDSLIENNIFQGMPSPQMLNGACSGCVIGYNFSINDANDASFLFNSLTLHSPVDNSLAEGNNGNSYRGDLFHGSHNFNTVFRNYYNGWETGITGGLVAEYLDPLSRYFNLIGNVLGRTGVHTSYQCVPGNCPGTPIYIIGTGTVNVRTGGDSLTVSSSMRWGNYDTVNAGVRFVSSEVPSNFSDSSGTPSAYINPVPANQTLPPSFYLSSQPSWWVFPSGTSAPFPAIGPDVSNGNLAGVGGHAWMIPAQNCYINVMGGPPAGTGNALTFNADNCYGTGGNGNGPPPPAGLTGTAK